MFLPTLILFGAVLPIPSLAAESLLRETDARIAAAKALRIEFEVQQPPDLTQRGYFGEVGVRPPPKPIAGSLVLGDRNRFRQEIGLNDPENLTIVVGDGRRVGEIRPGKKEAESRAQVDWYNEVLKSWLGRGGTVRSIVTVDRLAREPGAKRPGPGDAPQVANVRLLPDEEIGGVKCRVVGYDLSGRVGGITFREARVRVWIDPRTHLPVRREMTFQEKHLEGTWTATHKRFEIDPRLDDGLFKLPTEADMLLAQMEATIRRAKTLRIEFEIQGGAAKDFRPVKGSLTLADRNRFRYEDESFFVRPSQKLLVSDGKRIGGEWPLGGAAPRLPDWHNEALKSWLGRGGTFLSVVSVWHHTGAPGGKKPGPNDGPRVSDVRLLPDEEVGGVKCRVVGYDLVWRRGTDESVRARVRVWLDPKTKLPTRREMTFQEEPLKGRTWTALHTKFEIDPKMDDKLFELPK